MKFEHYCSFVGMASKLEEVLHKHIRLTKYDAITRVEVESRRNSKLHNSNLYSLSQ